MKRRKKEFSIKNGNGRSSNIARAISGHVNIETTTRVYFNNSSERYENEKKKKSS